MEGSAWVPPCLRWPGVMVCPSAAAAVGRAVEVVAGCGGVRRSLCLGVLASQRACHSCYLWIEIKYALDYARVGTYSY